MKKAVTVPVVVFVILAGLLYGVLANSHINIFPGQTCSNDHETQTLECESEMVSYLDHTRGVSSYGYSQMNAMGWLVFLLVVVGIPASVSFVLYKKMGNS